MSTSDSREAPTVTRRSALIAATAFGVAGCAASDPAPPGPSTPPRAPGGGLPWTASPGAGSGATGTVLGPAADVAVGGGKVYQDLEVVVTQPTAGRYEGFSAVCTHTACILAAVADGTINCFCHGSRFNLDGTVANGPAERSLTVRNVRVDAGQLVLE
jgi:Rieske Fe-S protein